MLSTNTTLADVQDYITDKLDNKLSVLAFFVDISKVFGCLYHNILLVKLEHYSVRGNILYWLNTNQTGRF